MRSPRCVLVRNGSNKYLVSFYFSRSTFKPVVEWVSNPSDACRFSPYIAQ